MKDLIINTNNLKNKTYQKIMFRLITIYKKECFHNEGFLSFNDLIVIYSLFYFLEKGCEQC